MIRKGRMPHQPRSKAYIGSVNRTSNTTYSGGSGGSGSSSSSSSSSLYQTHSWIPDSGVQENLLVIPDDTVLRGNLVIMGKSGVMAQCVVDICTSNNGGVFYYNIGPKPIYFIQDSDTKGLFFYGEYTWQFDGYVSSNLTLSTYSGALPSATSSNIVPCSMILLNTKLDVLGTDGAINAPVDIVTGNVSPTASNAYGIGTSAKRYEGVYAKNVYGDNVECGTTAIRESGVYTDQVVSAEYGTGRGFRVTQADGLICGGLDTSEIAFSGASTTYSDIEEPTNQAFEVRFSFTRKNASVDGQLYFLCGNDYVGSPAETFDAEGQATYTVVVDKSAVPDKALPPVKSLGNGVYSIKTYAGKTVDYTLIYKGTFSRAIKRPNPNIDYPVSLVDVNFYIKGNGSTDDTTMYEGLTKLGQVNSDNVIVLSGVNGTKVTATGVYRTTDGGTTWTKIV